jgi:hypothetical protein
VQAATPNPTDEIKVVFAKGNVSTLCAPDNAVRGGPLIGELSSAYKLNAFALPVLPAAAGIAAPDTVEGRTAAWIVYRQHPEFAPTGLSQAQSDALEAIGTDLSDYAVWLSANVKEPFGIVSGAALPDLAAARGAERARRRSELLASLLRSLLSPGQPQALLACRRSAEQIAKPDTPAAPGERAGNHFVIAVRGKIDDLAVPRNEPGTNKPGAAFKSASAASIAFTDNHQKGETSVAIDATVGVGRQIGRSDALFLFVRYAQTSTETKDPADDDDSKDIRALSPGILYRHNTRIGRSVYGTLGLTAYPTFDFAQDARSGRVRLFLEDIAISGIGRGPLCGRADRIGSLEISCRAGLFAEGAHVWRAGRSTDLATLEDDQYLGLGGNLKLGLSLPEIAALKAFSLTGEYRYMAIVSGPLADPHRLSVALNYKLTEQNLTFGIGYDEGSNFDTFQRERITKVTLGYKY